jgi:broad specificity phosphatase PhoE
MTTIIFVRHAESAANVFLHKGSKSIPHFTPQEKQQVSQKINALGNPSITEIGKKQSHQVAKYLVHKLIEEDVASDSVLVCASLFDRAASTAIPFIEEYTKQTTTNKQLKLYFDPRLCEYTKPEKRLSAGDIAKGIDVHNSWDEFTEQIKKFVSYIENVKHQYVIVFGHSLFLSTMTSYIGSSKTFMPNKSQLNFRVPNCSISTFKYSEDDCFRTEPEPGTRFWQIHQVASIAHLPKELVTGQESPFGTML